MLEFMIMQVAETYNPSQNIFRLILTYVDRKSNKEELLWKM